MKKLLVLFVFSLSLLNLGAQNVVVNDSAQYGFDRPRIVLIGDTMPYIIFGKSGNGSQMYGTKLVNGSFTQPIEVMPDSMVPRVGFSDGPNMVIHRDTLYVAWVNMETNDHHVYMSRSVDLGNSFEAPVRVDTVYNGDNLEYPGIAIGKNGDIGVYYIRTNSSWASPKQILIKSYDRGQTYSSELVVNSFAPGEPCECCQGNMAISDNDWVYYYRNNVNDIRNNYSLYSSDGGQNFSGVYEMDSLDWFIQACPTSGPEGYINGNQSFSTWMTRGSGSMRILYGSVDLSSGSITKGQFIDNSIASGNVQNHPALDGRGDTVAIVWHDNRFLFHHVFARISIDGGLSFGATRLVSDTTVPGSFNMGDVAFGNGVFHFTWRASNVVMYRSMNLSELVGVDELNQEEKSLELFPNPAQEMLTIQSVNQMSQFVVYDVTGKELVSGSPKSKAFTLNLERLKSGIYIVRVNTDKGVSVERFVKN